MHPPMHVQMILRVERLLAAVTRERPNVGMDELVNIQVSFRHKRLPAHVTDVRSLIEMHLHVALQLHLAREPLAARGALEPLNTAVNGLVAAQMAQLAEAHAALVTLVHLFVLVHLVVVAQGAGRMERLLAELADKTAFVCVKSQMRT